ncbi:hypothetical protein P7K49_019237 [Saguinus oedipus]|uniref:Alpha-2-macroglobulin domain-containing protein n=1 Tax=Saguinus oedipus TaxID=9490 RepID=A0ABQ9UXJ5_SAGOE|nr:hypothetical protein P7K49_019237 [Saguinus oedipus]
MQLGLTLCAFTESCNPDSTGAANLKLTVPDTITQWKASGFCMNDRAGFGLSPTVSMTAFQPFFVDLTLPYSVIRGEAFTLKANVFNYLNRCIQVNSVLRASSTVNLTVTAETLQNSGCRNGSSTAPDIGWRDTLIKPLLVENMATGKD